VNLSFLRPLDLFTGDCLFRPTKKGQTNQRDLSVASDTSLTALLQLSTEKSKRRENLSCENLHLENLRRLSDRILLKLEESS
jgi:hypothetical protein